MLSPSLPLGSPIWTTGEPVVTKSLNRAPVIYSSPLSDEPLSHSLSPSVMEPWNEGSPHVVTVSNSCHVGLLHYQLPPKDTLQAYWPHRPETFPMHLELYHIWEPPSLIHQALYHHYRHTMLGYAISELGQEAWIFYKWVHSAIDVVNQHSFHSVFEYEPVAQLDGRTTMTMIMWDELDMEMRHHPLLQAWKLHICNIIPSLPLVPGPNLNLSDPKGLLTQFLPSMSELLLQPFPTE